MRIERFFNAPLGVITLVSIELLGLVFGLSFRELPLSLGAAKRDAIGFRFSFRGGARFGFARAI
jgi:hypothetical protein